MRARIFRPWRMIRAPIHFVTLLQRGGNGKNVHSPGIEEWTAMLNRLPYPAPQRIAVIGSGISGLSAAWLLAGRHNVTLMEAEGRIGGHSHTVDVMTARGKVAVDTGFIVHNRVTYPNLTALFAHLGVETRPTRMSFAVSLDGGRLEYAGGKGIGLLAQPANAVKPRFLAMVRDIVRFYREAPARIRGDETETLDAWLDRHGYGRALREDHLYPMAAAIWSTPAGSVGGFPVGNFVRFCDNHGLLKLANRPTWRTVAGGSRAYVDAMMARFPGRVAAGDPVRAVSRQRHGVVVRTRTGEATFDHVVIAAHADQALALLSHPTARERALLGAFRYTDNETVLHGDGALMPVRRRAWAAWNYLAEAGDASRLSVTYWMNQLQGIDAATPLFVTLNPLRAPREDLVHLRQTFRHPLFDASAIDAQKRLWSIQGEGGVWFAGAWFGAGFHEDGLQAGLAVAEAIGGVRRPWTVAGESARIPALAAESWQTVAHAAAA